MRRKWGGSQFVRLLVVLMLVVGCLRTIAAVLGVDHVALWWQTQYRIDALACGVLLAVLSVHRPRAFNRLVGLKPLWLAITVCGVLWFALVPVTSTLGVTAGFTLSFITSAAFMLLVYRSHLVRRVEPALRPVAVLGVFSYAIYLWHLAMSGAIWKFAGFALGHDALVGMVLQHAGVVLFAIVVTRLVEWPVLRLRDRLVPSRSRPTPRQDLPPTSAPR